jgi:cysteine desulfurase
MRAYFDHNATTPVAPEILAQMSAVAAEVYGNPSSIHRTGQAGKKLLEEARERVAGWFGCGPKEVVFTGGGTEADNLAILGVVHAAVRADARAARHVITSAIEHPAVLEACAQLEREGVSVTYLQPTRGGLIEPDRVARQIRPETVLVSILHANNETGVVQPIAAIGALCREAGVLFHSDGVQAAGKIDVRVNDLNVDLYAISGHKLNALKGVGALYVREGVKLAPLMHGGKHERQRRPSTENLLGIWSLGIACGLPTRLDATLRDRLEAGILAQVPDARVNGAASPRVPNTTNIQFAGLEGEAMVISLDLKGFAVSTGAACSSGSLEPSHVLIAMGLMPAEAKASIRFSLGLGNTVEEVDALIEAVAQSAAHLRRLSPTYSHA